MEPQITYIKYSNDTSINDVVNAINKDGICIIEDFFSDEQIDLLENEVDRLLTEQKGLIQIDDKEDCSKDERIFHAERHSKDIADLFANNSFINGVCKQYIGTHPTMKKTMINRVVFSEHEVRNSGAGWHRDNHDLQFKAIMYLTDVDETKGNFRWITNSHKKHIGFPTPRTTSYNTRFADDVVEDVLKNHSDCKIIDIIGKRGTMIIANTSYVHRGNIIQSGERKAITQYFI